MRIFFISRNCRHCLGQTRLRREKFFHRRIFARGIFADFGRVRQRASRAFFFHRAHQLAEPHHAQRRARARATVRHAADFVAPLRVQGGFDLLELLASVCLKYISTSSRKLSALLSVKSFRRSISTGGSAIGRFNFWRGRNFGFNRRISRRTPFFNHAANVAGADRLGQIIIHAGGEAFFAVALHARARSWRR